MTNSEFTNVLNAVNGPRPHIVGNFRNYFNSLRMEPYDENFKKSRFIIALLLAGLTISFLNPDWSRKVMLLVILSFIAIDFFPYIPTIVTMARKNWGWPNNPITPDYSDLVYGIYQEKNLTLDIYLPKGKEENSPFPLIVFIHGGGWFMGNKKLIEPGIFRLIKEGYAVASIGYSLSGEAQWPTQGYQIKGAVRWLRANAYRYHIDPDKFIAFGGSAGGHLASFLGTTNGLTEFDSAEYGNMEYSSSVQGVVAWYAPTDLLLKYDFSILNLLVLDGNRLNPRSPRGKLIGGAISRNTDIAQKASPQYYISPNTTVPFLIMHGNKDVIVPVEQSLSFYKKLQNAGIKSQLVILNNYRHVDIRFNNQENMRSVIEFINDRA